MNYLLLLLCLSPLVSSHDVDTEKAVELFDGAAKALLHIIEEADLTNYQLDATEMNGGSSSKNLLFDPLIKIIRNMLANATMVQTGPIGNLTWPLFVNNATIYGLNNTTITLDAPKFGYTIKNLTVHLPLLEVTSDKYIMNQLNLSVVVLDGEGDLRISLKNFTLSTGMILQYSTKTGFKAGYLTMFKAMIDSSKIDLENLGGSGDALSGLLNSIATEALPEVVQLLSNGLTQLIDDNGGNGDCNASKNMEDVCSKIDDLLNGLYCALLDADFCSHTP